ncbi:MAG: hypothetical protein KGN84_02415, partial [Acidobacteriota bacterium]|nr:hypothetical protein [Acidobacteriota bacterium]
MPAPLKGTPGQSLDTTCFQGDKPEHFRKRAFRIACYSEGGQKTGFMRLKTAFLVALLGVAAVGLVVAQKP